MKTKHLAYCLFILLCCACTSHNSEPGKHYSSWDKVVDVKGQVHEIDTDSILVSSNSYPYATADYLLIVDYMSMDDQIYAFDKGTFRYAGSFARRGGGPKEITQIGNLGIDDQHHSIYISDFGKQKIFYCNVDSALTDTTYAFKEVATLSKTQFPSEYTYINDTLCIGRFISPIGINDYLPQTAKWNMRTGEHEVMKYEYPGIEHKRMTCDASIENQLYVECHTYHDLLSICDFDGNLKCNIYGPNWDENPKDMIHCFGRAVFRKNQIIVAYSGKDNHSNDNFLSKFHVFDIEGNYLKTLDVGYRLIRFCYDSTYDRLIMCFDDDIQYGYLDLKNLI